MWGEGWAYFTTAVLAVWFAFMARTCQESLRMPRPSCPQAFRWYLTIAGTVCSIVALASLLLLRLVWTSVEIAQHRLPWVSTENYQHLNVTAIKTLSVLWLGSSVAGLVLGVAGTKRKRILVVVTSLVTALWWLFLLDERHPARYLIPDGYVGWVEIRFAQTNATLLPIESGNLVYRIPDNGLLETSTPLEYGSAKDKYFYHSKDGSLRELKSIPWEPGNMIWGATNSQTEEFFFVGTEEQSKKPPSTGRKGPYDDNVIPDPKYP